MHTTLGIESRDYTTSIVFTASWVQEETWPENFCCENLLVTEIAVFLVISSLALSVTIQVKALSLSAAAVASKERISLESTNFAFSKLTLSIREVSLITTSFVVASILKNSVRFSQLAVQSFSM